MTKQLLSMTEAIKHTGFSRASITDYVKRGILPYINIGAGEKLVRYKFKTTELENLIDKLQKGA